MARHRDALSIAKAAPHAFLDDGFGRQEQLVDEGVIHRLGVRPDDGHGGIFHQGIALGQEEARAGPGNA